MSYKNKQIKVTQASASAKTDAKQPAGQKKSNKFAASRNSGDIVRQPEAEMALGRQNFIYMAGAGALIVIGFLLMLGSSSTVDNFEPDIFSTRRIVIGPLLAFLGFVAMAVAIIMIPKKKKRAADATGEPSADATSRG